MENRREPRFAADEPVTLTILGDRQRSLPARVVNASGAGLGLLAGEPVEPGTAMRVEARDMILLGETVYCQSRSGDWAVGVRLEHALYGAGELARLVREILGEDSGERQRTDPVKDGQHQYCEQTQQKQNGRAIRQMPPHEAPVKDPSDHRVSPISELR